MSKDNPYHKTIKPSNIRDLEIEEKPKLKPVDWGEENNEEFEKSQRKVKEMTKQILEISEEARGNDLILFFECIRLQYPNIEVENARENIIIKIPRELIRSIQSPELYARSRRKFNEQNMFLPKSNVILRRRMKEKAYKKFYAKEKK